MSEQRVIYDDGPNKVCVTDKTNIMIYTCHTAVPYHVEYTSDGYVNAIQWTDAAGRHRNVMVGLSKEGWITRYIPGHGLV